MNNSLLSVKNISKVFPGVKALDQVSFDVNEGEIHSIVGENGAGKSTLMNILSGVYHPSEGDIIYNGKEVKFKSTHHAQKLGIAMIHQELSLAKHLTVMENIYIGRLSQSKAGFVNFKARNKECQQLLEQLGIEGINSEDVVQDLSVSKMQMVEIAKALSLESKLLIMDEPTSSLTTKETNMLIKIMDKLKASGVSILFISHRMEEVFQLSDQITVLRDGQYIKTLSREEADVKQVLSLMVGREFDAVYKREKKKFEGVPLLEVKGMSDKSRIKDISFKVYSGEVLAITGLVGAGRSEVIQAIFGIEKRTSGELLIDGKPVRINSPKEAIAHGIGLVPEGRKTQGLFLERSVKENISMANIQLVSKFNHLNLKKEVLDADTFIDKLSIKTPSKDQEIKYLSGGNQQKAIIARWLINQPRILFLDEPTHGIDIGAKSEIYELIDELAAKGVGVVIISSEMPEVLSLADRILIMHNGQIKGELDHDGATQELIMALAADQ